MSNTKRNKRSKFVTLLILFSGLCFGVIAEHQFSIWEKLEQKLSN